MITYLPFYEGMCRLRGSGIKRGRNGAGPRIERAVPGWSMLRLKDRIRGLIT
jgi:hypothetical protein